MKVQLDALIDQDCDVLIQSVDPKVAPIFSKYSQEEKRSLYRYLFSRRPQKLPPSMKNRLVNLYDPLADRKSRFADGLRWCVNVYVGCQHDCGYCYVNAYAQDEIEKSHPKKNFQKKLGKDLQEVKTLQIPPAPIHLSNSTDPLQEKMEREYKHTFFLFEKLQEYRENFTSIVLLTKNPGLLCNEPYLSLIKNPGMQPLTIQITCAFWKDEARSFFEPHAPAVENRLQALQFLSEQGVNVDLRIDPLFPSSQVAEDIRRHAPLSNYSIHEAQSKEDLINLVRFAGQEGITKIVTKPLRIPLSNKAKKCKSWFSDLYRDANNGKRVTRGGSWRLPLHYQKELMSTLSSLCKAESIELKHCMNDVLGRS